jgi:hypothetical protein
MQSLGIATAFSERADTYFDHYRGNHQSMFHGYVLMFGLIGHYGDPCIAYRAVTAHRNTALSTFAELLGLDKMLVQYMANLRIRYDAVTDCRCPATNRRTIRNKRLVLFMSASATRNAKK